MPCAVFDCGDLVFLPQVRQPPGKNILQEGKHSSGFLRVWCQPCTTVLGNLNVSAPFGFRDGRRQFHEILVQIDCRPVEPQGFRSPDTAEKRHCKEWDKAVGVSFRRRHNGCYLIDRVKLDFGRIPLRKVESADWVIGAESPFDPKVEEPSKNPNREIADRWRHAIQCPCETFGRDLG